MLQVVQVVAWSSSCTYLFRNRNEEGSSWELMGVVSRIGVSWKNKGEWMLFVRDVGYKETSASTYMPRWMKGNCEWRHCLKVDVRKARYIDIAYTRHSYPKVTFLRKKKKTGRKGENLSPNEFDFSFCFYDNIIVIKQTFTTNKKIYINTRDEYEKNKLPLDED